MADRVVVLKGDQGSDTKRRSANFVFNGSQCDVAYLGKENRPTYRRQMPSVKATLHIAWLEKRGMTVDVDELDVDLN